MRLRRPAVLGQRSFRILLCAEAISAFGDGLVPIALAFAVLELGGGAEEVGLVLAARTLPLVVCLVFGGVVADRLPRRAVMVTADLVRFGTQALLAGLLISGAADVAVVAVLAGATGAATGFFRPASTALLPAVVEPRLLHEANGLRATLTSGGEILGPAVGGVLIAAASPGWALAVDAGTYAISAALLARLMLERRAAPAASRFLADLRDGWTAFRSRRWVWVTVLGAALGNLAWGAWSVLGPVTADRRLGGADAWGTVLAVMGAGALLGGAVAMRAVPRRPLVWAATGFGVSSTVPLAALAAGAPFAVLVLAAGISGAAVMLGNSIWETTLQRHVPDDTLSRVSAYDWFGSLAFYPLGVALWGPVAAIVGTSTAIWVAAAASLAVWVAVLALRDVRRVSAFPVNQA
jgi:predicted MFS family arabinose efflux permease